MKAIAVLPGQTGSVHLADLPHAGRVRDPRRAWRAREGPPWGCRRDDREINAAEYGAAPDGYPFLVIGHESFGRVEAVRPHVTFLRPGDYVVATVRRPGGSIYDAIGLQDMTTDGQSFERGINLRHGCLTEYYVEKRGVRRQGLAD